MQLTLTQLSPLEIETILKKDHFDRLHPVSCQSCGSTGPFERMLFLIGGIPKKMYKDESIQGVIRTHLLAREQLIFVHFKTFGSFYADAAKCRSCGSSSIVYDIDVSPDLINALARELGKSPADMLEILNTATGE